MSAIETSPGGTAAGAPSSPTNGHVDGAAFGPGAPPGEELQVLGLRCRDCDGPYMATPEAIERTGGSCPFCGAGADRQLITRRES